MKFRAYIKDEGTDECRWFVYVEYGGSSTYACRFARERTAQKIANAMNNAWRQEGRLLETEQS